MEILHLKQDKMSVFKMTKKLTRRTHNLLEFAFDLGWPIMTGPRRDYGITHRTLTPRYEMVSLAMLYN